MKIPADTKEFAINASNQRFWEAPVQRYVDGMPGRQDRPARQGLQHALGGLDGRRSAPHPDPRRHLHVPASDTKDPAKAGKLRLLYEANPMTFIVEQAGGAVHHRPRTHPGHAPRKACTSACR